MGESCCRFGHSQSASHGRCRDWMSLGLFHLAERKRLGWTWKVPGVATLERCCNTSADPSVSKSRCPLSPGPVVSQSSCVPIPSCPGSVVSQSSFVPVPLCPSPVVSQSSCVPIPLCPGPVVSKSLVSKPHCIPARLCSSPLEYLFRCAPLRCVLSLCVPVLLSSTPLYSSAAGTQWDQDESGRRWAHCGLAL